ncbi:sensor histidine kinase [Holdemanella biformis]|jgi:histidine kinase|uniref:sensor histidine kinase n=1 Tax=Holdemanella biformis TaxID=1735 RepID=UPI000EE951AA|nr:HAMP domain-containing sensor histidine kinase [Holdemanella biformis]HCR68510.1 two-component sensor histidine kinase [Erysipelotrichaceae bacterium]
MKNLKIFPKICIQTFSVIAIIVLFIHLFVYLIFPRTYLDVRKEEIYTKANEITENLNGKSEDYIEQALDFYSNTNEIKAFIKKNAASNEVEIKNDLNVDLRSSNNSLIIEERKLKLDTGKTIRLQFVSTADMQSQAKNLSLQFLPYSLILSLCFSAIVSFVYAKSIKNYVVEIKRVTDQMMALDKKACLAIDSNDEIGQLKAQINDLYETLLDSISNLELKNKEILRLEKIKYDFFKGASHELKTPLASLKIILENMKYNVGKYKNRDVYIDDCIDLVDHLTKSIQQILSVYSIENLKDDEEIVCIKNELSRVLQKYDVLIHQKELRIQNDVKDETMYIGKTALNIILSNLISNAINYTYEKGMIQIGIEQDYFYIQNKQDPTQPKGNGLGLYIVRNLLDNYKMKYEVIEGEDFIFKIQFKQQVF